MTIIALNAVSLLIASLGIGGYLARQRRRRRKLLVQPVYVAGRR